jgi:hypothetical protein
LWSQCASSDEVFRPVEKLIESVFSIEDIVRHEDVSRYRLVYVDSNYLWDLFATTSKEHWGQDGITLDLALFDGETIEVRLESVSHSSDRLSATGTFSSTAHPDACELRGSEKTEFLVTTYGRVWANIFWDSCKIGLFPIDSGPVHLLAQWND